MARKTYTDPLLTSVALGYKPLGHIHKFLAPELSVKKATGKIGSYGADNLRIVTAYKGEDAETPTVRMSTAINDGWALEQHALKAFASDREAENEDAPFKVQRDRMEFVMDLLSTLREYGLASYMGTVGNFTNSTTLSGTSQWGGSADDPVGDINTAIETCAQAIGVPQSMLTLTMSIQVWRVLRFLPEITELVNTTGRIVKRPDERDIAEAFGIKNVLVAESYYNTAAEGKADSLAPIWGKHAWIGHHPGPDRRIQPFAFTFHNRKNLRADKWYDQDREGWWVRARDEYDQLVLNEQAVYMIEDAVA